MIRFDYECECAHSFSTYVEEGASIKCPYCGKNIQVPVKEKDPVRKQGAKSLEDATYEIISEGGVSFSGAR